MAPAPGSGADSGPAARQGRAEPGAPLHLLVLGDSTAAGVGVSAQEDALAGHLAAGLARECGREVAWRVVARSGADARTVVAELLPAAAGAVDSAGVRGVGGSGEPPRPDLAVVLIGVNDVKAMTGRGAFHRAVTAIAAGAGERWQAPAVFGAVPRMDLFPALPRPLGPLLGLRSRHLDAAMRAALRSQPHAVRAPFPAGAVGRPGFFAADGFHPGERGYRIWARHLLPVCLDALRKSAAEPDGARPTA
ncbi:SGNH/GDSL hydrolase family protein [Streptomonospora sp. PA3]|uniref:GDSL-type esterase/lipase family protein n=1 Tax=Streptomonospora sp. PA3 TaxID=2607326 RepID=UPI00164260FF